MASMESTVLFDDESLSELKSLSAEELLVKCIGIIEGFDLKPLKNELNDISKIKRDDSLIKLKCETSLIKEKIKSQLPILLIYLGEIYRRNIMSVIIFINCIDDYLVYKCFLCNVKKIEYHMFCDNNQPELICSNCNDSIPQIMVSDGYGYGGFRHQPAAITRMLCDDDLTRKQIRAYESLYNLFNGGKYFKDKLQEIQMVKETMLRIMKTPLLTKELETCMDEILDLNGNRISQLKEYLTEDQYRFVRSGAKFDELEGQQDMLERMNKMLKQLKMTSIGESLLDLPVARPITPEIKHLERELESHNFRQKKHEKDLEKLKSKI
jgi:hypothetical protein